MAFRIPGFEMGGRGPNDIARHAKGQHAAGKIRSSIANDALAGRQNAMPRVDGFSMTRELRKSPSTVPTRLATAARSGLRHATFSFPNRRLPNPLLDHAALWRSQTGPGKSSEK